MIPKVIHYCWFGYRQKPQELQQFLEECQEILPDFELKEWNERNFDVNVCYYTREAYNMKCYANVSNVCRLFAIFNEGGVFVDTDIEVIKPPEQSLYNKSFIGIENDSSCSIVVGAEPHQKWVGYFLDYYLSHHFLNIIGCPKQITIAKILSKIILPKMRRELRPKIYPRNYFCGMEWNSHCLKRDSKTKSKFRFGKFNKTKRTSRSNIITILKGLKYRYTRCFAH